MPYPERSRSPLRKTPFSEKISRQIASFGRYADKRPPGLEVDSSGAFRLDELMNVWGRSEGLKEHDILDSVRRHMLNDGGEGGTSVLRFAIDTDRQGHIIIRVMPKKQVGEPLAPAFAAPVPAVPVPTAPSKQRPQLTEALEVHSPAQAVPATTSRQRSQLTVRTIRGSVLQGLAEAPEFNMAVSKPAVKPTVKQELKEAKEEDVMEVDSTAGEAEAKNLEAPGKEPRALDPRAFAVRRAIAQMGLTEQTQHIRQAPLPSTNCEDRWNSWGARGRRPGDSRHVGEKVQRFLGWVLKHGHRELMVNVDVAGWASLDTLVAAMRHSRPDLGDFTAEKLKALLDETDQAGRFEISAGKLRKVDRDSRFPRGSGGPPADGPPRPTPSRAATAEAGGPYQRRARSISVSSSGSRRRRSSPPPPASPSAAAAAIPNDAPPAAPTENREAPPLPPGPHWTKYQDEGKDWFYYDGPLGKWWHQCGCGNEVMPYDEDDA